MSDQRLACFRISSFDVLVLILSGVTAFLLGVTLESDTLRQFCSRRFMSR